MNSSKIQINWMRKKSKKEKKNEDQRYGKLTLFRLTQVNKSQSICFSSTQSYIDRHWNVCMCRLKKRIRQKKENLEK